ncbi:MAG TPA: hypothetical protein VFB84_21815 [Micromonosporaceae bacterium]|nr:hypothetical protein [Micromonosporaceae bacterium]
MSVAPRPESVMTREEADRAIAQLEADVGRFAETLMTAVEGHPGHRYLSEHSVCGRTRDVWRELEQRMRLLGAYYHLLNSTLQSARRLRDRRDRPGHTKLVELTRMLRGDVVGLGTDGAPVEPGFPAPAGNAPAEKVSLATLSKRLDQESADIITVLTQVHEMSVGVTTRLSTLASALGQVRTDAAALGVRPDPAIEQLVAVFAELSRSAIDDPLGTADTGSAAAGPGSSPVDVALHAVEADVEAIRRRLVDLSALRDAYPERMDALRRLVNAVAIAEEEAHQAYSAVVAKILQPGLSPSAGQAGGLQAALADIERYERRHRWQRIAQALPALERAGGAALDRARERTRQATALLARREELRGRLDSYRVKADRHGLGEHAALSTVYQEAWGLLWTAPCDLPAAARAVWRYQELLANPPDGEGDATP